MSLNILPSSGAGRSDEEITHQYAQVMAIPFWKRALSYLMEVPVEFVASGTHKSLSVRLSRGRYQLTTPNAIYSYGDLYGNFVRVFEELKWERLGGTDVLLLGLGLGSIPFMLERKFNKSLSYTAIDIDAQVIRLAQKYVLCDLKSPVTTYQADATDFVRQTSGQWHLICVDIFVDDVIPEPVLRQAFVEEMRSCIAPGGVLLYNCLSRTADDIAQTSDFLDNTFLKVFPEGGILDVGGNWILTSDKSFF